ncbi:hypothetical protein HETIRDRAFT_324916, partial [Heterobasidion irregulare TC 32-1]
HPAPGTWVKQARILKYNGIATGLSNKPPSGIDPLDTPHSKPTQSALPIATMSYQGYQGQTGHREPYLSYPDQWATYSSTYGLPSWDHTYGYHQPVAHNMHPYASPGQYGESGRNDTPPSMGRVEARRHGNLQGAGLTMVYLFLSVGYHSPPMDPMASLPRYDVTPEFVWSESTMRSHGRGSMAQAQTTQGIQHTPWRMSEVEAIQTNTNEFNNGGSMKCSAAAQPFAEGVLASVAGPSTSRIPPVPPSSTTDQATKSKGRVMECKSARGAKGRTQASAKAQILGKAVATKRTMPPGDGPWICHVEGQEYARYWEILRHKETTKGHDEYKGPCICVCGAEFTRSDAMSRHHKRSCPLRSRPSSHRR